MHRPSRPGNLAAYYQGTPAQQEIVLHQSPARQDVTTRPEAQRLVAKVEALCEEVRASNPSLMKRSFIALCIAAGGAVTGHYIADRLHEQKMERVLYEMRVPQEPRRIGETQYAPVSPSMDDGVAPADAVSRSIGETLEVYDE